MSRTGTIPAEVRDPAAVAGRLVRLSGGRDPAVIDDQPGAVASSTRRHPVRSDTARLLPRADAARGAVSDLRR
jgi:hypothetical protein